ncbi:MAG TPA: hypothetical protein VMS65_02450 [Polyangiaceae bacterium]|nr:hypothetical protein [Polyangiaceae bacterium]
MIPLRFRPLLSLLIASTCFLGCRDEVPLGSWSKAPGDAGNTPPTLPECLASTGELGPVTPGGPTTGVTVPYTDFDWPAPFASIEWEMRVEQEPTTDGTIWANQVAFADGSSALVALQARGGFQADPPSGPVVRTKMVQFWISGPPLEAELGDIQYPDARAYQTLQAGSSWWTIDARFDWVTCRAYRLRVEPDTIEPGRGVWYRGLVIDTETAVETLIGRILVPEASGGLTAPTTSFSNRIGWTPLIACADAEPVSVLFGTPLADGARPESLSRTHRFGDPLACADTRFTVFPDAVRQEVGFAE